jgi:hypothetical protein
MKDKSPHILNASSNLLGICFLILTSLKAFKMANNTIVDEVVTLAIVIFTASSLLSFLAIRSEAKSSWFENLADIIFLCGLGLLFITTLILALRIVS